MFLKYLTSSVNFFYKLQEFEKAVVENSILLTDITKRFASINQWAIKSVNNWWKTVKVYIQKYWQVSLQIIIIKIN